MAKIGRAVEGPMITDLHNLIAAIQGMKIADVILVLGQANSVIKNLYEKLWGKK